MENPTINTEAVLVPESPDGLDYGHHVPATNSPEDTSTLESGQKKPKSARKLFPNIGQSKELDKNENNENNENKSICNTVTCGIQGGRKTRKKRRKRKRRKTKRRRRRKTKKRKSKNLKKTKRRRKKK